MPLGKDQSCILFNICFKIHDEYFILKVMARYGAYMNNILASKDLHNMLQKSVYYVLWSVYF